MEYLYGISFHLIDIGKGIFFSSHSVRENIPRTQQHQHTKKNLKTLVKDGRNVNHFMSDQILSCEKVSLSSFTYQLTSPFSTQLEMQ